MVNPYPSEWPRNIDFLPVLSLQASLDPHLELAHCETLVSVPIGKATRGRSIRTPLGGIIKQDETRRQMTNFVYGGIGATSLRTTSPVSQREILEDILGQVEVPDAVVKARVAKTDIPKAVENEKPVQGEDYLLHKDVTRANFIHKMRTSFGLYQLSNPYRIAMDDLVTHGITPQFEQKSRIKSVLRTDWLVGQTKGYSDLQPVLTRILNGLSSRKWWQDIGTPHPLSGRIDGRVVAAQVYLLARHDQLLAV